MKNAIVAVMTLGAIIAPGDTMAAKVNIPKEGNYEFDFCPIGRGKTFSEGDKCFVMNYGLDAIVKSTPPGIAFDRMGARCYGIYANVSGRQQESNFCELTDLDGVKWGWSSGETRMA